MSREPLDSHHPAPHRERTSRWELAGAVCGAPLAWFVMLNFAFTATTAPCYEEGWRRVLDPLPHYDLAFAATVGVYLLCLAVAIASILLSLRLLRRTRGEVHEEHRSLLEVGEGRTHFLAMWGLLTGVTFGLVIFVNALGLVLVPPCAG